MVFVLHHGYYTKLLQRYIHPHNKQFHNTLCRAAEDTSYYSYSWVWTKKNQLILTNSQQQSSTHFHIAFRSVWCNICRYCNTKIVAYYGVSKSKPRTSLFWVDGLLRFCVHENKTSPCPYHFSSEVEEANEEFTTINSTVNKQILLEPIPPNLRHKLISSLIKFWHATIIKTNAILGIHAIMWNTCETWCCHLYSFCLI